MIVFDLTFVGFPSFPLGLNSASNAQVDIHRVCTHKSGATFRLVKKYPPGGGVKSDPGGGLQLGVPWLEGSIAHISAYRQIDTAIDIIIL